MEKLRGLGKDDVLQLKDEVIKDVPLTLESGEQIGTATARMTNEGLEIEGTVDAEHAHLVRSISTSYSLPDDGSIRLQGSFDSVQASEKSLDEILAAETANLTEMVEEIGEVIEMQSQTPYKPNRQQRRAAERKQKRDRKFVNKPGGNHG